ncbi:host specificity factor TipJ family phage tail protein [Elioraea sp.]|uniref:host specificity factor TipJ family phage tail protein n=1 Tax=Elioraea sp. TaxID=2185103 RepID=UPI0025BF34E1|nr:host specificity factor TipJ family phage tail protein [Elioraea sp.]
MSAPGEVRVIALPKPFSGDRTDYLAPAGLTVAQLLNDAPIDPALRAFTQVWLVDPNGGADPAWIPRENWHLVKPREGMLLQLRVVPQGGGGGGKNPLRTILSIAVIAAAFFLGPALGGAILSGIYGSVVPATILGVTSSAFATALGGFLITAVGTLAINALVPPPKPSLSSLTFGGATRTSPTLSITGSANRSNPYGPVPRVFGRHRVYPPMAARPVTESEGDQQFLRLLFDFGYGPLELSDLRIGAVPIEQFEGVEIEIRQGFPEDPPATLYSRTIRQDEYSLKITEAGGPQILETRDAAAETTIDVAFGGLLTFGGDGSQQNRSVTFRTEWRLLPDGEWVSAGETTVTAATTSTVRQGVRIVFPTPGRHALRFTRLTPDTTSATVRDEMFVTAVRSIQPDYPLRRSGRCIVAMRIKATDQLSGVVDQFSAVAQALLPVWNGAEWVRQPTRNHAWAYLEVLRGTANPRPISDDRIDLQAFVDWAADCDAAAPDGVAPRWTFDAVVDAETTVFELLRDIAASGRAAFGMRDGRFSIVRDIPQIVPIQHFTPRNSWNFSGRKLFPDRAQGVRVRYIEPEREWQQQEVIVYADGFDENTAQRLETLEMWGCTRRAQGWREGRYHLAVAQLRPETYEISCDVEHLIATRGDLVRVAHDVPLWGIGWGRVAELEEESGDVVAVTIDAAMEVRADRLYTVRVRRSDATGHVYSVVPEIDAEGLTRRLVLAVPIPLLDAPAIGDLVQFGEAGRESALLLVKQIQPGPDLTARLTLVDAAPDVHAADAGGVIPPFDPGMTLPFPPPGTPPLVPAIDEVYSGTRALIRGGDGSIISRIAVGVAARDEPFFGFMQLRWRRSESAEPWQIGPAAEGVRTTLYASPVEDEAVYELQVRATTRVGAASAWSASTMHQVLGKAAAPSDVQGFAIAGRDVDWLAVQDLDLAGYIIRWAAGASVEWERAVPAHGGLLTSSPFTLPTSIAGDVTILIKAIDTSGNESLEAARIIVGLGDPVPENAAAAINYRALTWPGTRVSAEVVGGDLVATLDGSAPMWPDDAAAMWHSTSGAMWPPDAWSAMAYEDTVSFSSPPSDARVLIEAEFEGDGARLLWRKTAPIWTDDGAALWTADADPMWGTGGASWTAWPGVAAASEGAFEIRVEIGAGATRGRIRRLRAILDAKSIVEQLADVSIAAAGTRLPITKTYAAIGAVQLTLQGGTTARTALLIDKDQVLGPLVQALDATGTGVAATVDASIFGY